MNSLHVLLMIVLRYMNSLEQILKEPQENMEKFVHSLPMYFNIYGMEWGVTCKYYRLRYLATILINIIL